jgi:uncharacterized membrane protein YeiH
VIIFNERLQSVHKIIFFIDALGLATFAVVGAMRAMEVGLGAFGVVAIAVVTAVGGGIARDIFTGDVPSIFYKDFYATPAVLAGLLVVLGGEHMGIFWAPLLVVLVTFMVRVWARKLQFELWRPSQAGDS